MKNKKQIIKKLSVPTIPSNWESAESYTVKMIGKIFVVICIAAVIVLSIFLLRNKPQIPTQQAPPPPKVPVITLKNQTFLAVDNMIFFNISKKDWTTITNAFPNNIKKDTVVFSK